MVKATKSPRSGQIKLTSVVTSGLTRLSCKERDVGQWRFGFLLPAELILTAELAWSRFLPSLCDTGPRRFSIDCGAVYESAPNFLKRNDHLSACRTVIEFARRIST
jgi:hypothetical protein